MQTCRRIERSACPTCGSCSGMFTANSMNCLTEALGLSLPGNGSTARDSRAIARQSVPARRGGSSCELATRYYEQATMLAPCPASIATFKTAFENAMSLDIAMGGSTNTVLHLLAAAQEGEVDVHDARHRSAVASCSRRLCKVAPSASHVHMEDVHRAGGVMGDSR